jgi:hypothetical protein
MQLLEPEVGVDLPKSNYSFKDVYEKARIACTTAMELNKRGMPIEIDQEDNLFAEQIIKGQVKPPVTHVLSAGTAIKLGAILEEYDVQVARSAAQLRTVATNKLIAMLDDPDPKNQLRAIEMIGKMADVGLFAERTEITINHKTTVELEQELVKLVSDYADVELLEDGASREEEETESFGAEEGDDEDPGDAEPEESDR